MILTRELPLPPLFKRGFPVRTISCIHPLLKRGGRGSFSFFFFLFFIFFSFSAFAQTFVSLKPNITETLIDLGASDKIIGITKFCVKPNAQAAVIADYQNINVEALLRLHPDFILLSKENTQKKQFEQLDMAFANSQTQIVVLGFDTVEEFFTSYVKLAELLKQDAAAKERVVNWKNQLEQVRRDHHALSHQTFAIIVQREPLIVASGHTYLSSLLSTMGLENVFTANQIPYPTLNPETLLQKHPDLLFDMSHHASDNPQFWGQTVIPIKIEDFLAHPKSVENAMRLVTSAAKP